jgi:hypothetical protein
MALAQRCVRGATKPVEEEGRLVKNESALRDTAILEPLRRKS